MPLRSNPKPRTAALIAAALALAACGPADRQPDAAASQAAAPAVPAATPAQPATQPDSAVPEAPPQTVGSVCPDPDAPCDGFRAHDLSFVLPRDGVARAEAESEPFFAVLLRSGPECSIADADRRAPQDAFPGRKVFAHRFGCDDDVENNVTYTGVTPGLAFLAVFAGRTRAEADSMLSAIRATGAYPGANLRRMQVKLVHP
jgi:hypothetical protein